MDDDVFVSSLPNFFFTFRKHIYPLACKWTSSSLFHFSFVKTCVASFFVMSQRIACVCLGDGIISMCSILTTRNDNKNAGNVTKNKVTHIHDERLKIGETTQKTRNHLPASHVSETTMASSNDCQFIYLINVIAASNFFCHSYLQNVLFFYFSIVFRLIESCRFSFLVSFDRTRLDFILCIMNSYVRRTCGKFNIENRNAMRKTST